MRYSCWLYNPSFFMISINDCISYYFPILSFFVPTSHFFGSLFLRRLTILIFISIIISKFNSAYNISIIWIIFLSLNFSFLCSYFLGAFSSIFRPSCNSWWLFQIYSNLYWLYSTRTKTAHFSNKMFFKKYCLFIYVKFKFFRSISHWIKIIMAL